MTPLRMTRSFLHYGASVCALSLLLSCNQGNELQSQTGTVASEGSSVAILLQQLNQADLNSLVFLNDVRIERTSGGSALYAVGKHGQRMMLISPSSKKKFEVSADSVVDVFGTIQKAPSITVAKRYLKLDKSEAAALTKVGFYLEPTSIVEQGRD